MKKTLYTYFTGVNQIAKPDATRVLGPIVTMPIHKKDDNDSLYNMLPEVVVTAKYPHEQRVIDTMNASNAEFMGRLRNNDRRAIHNQDGSYSTHVLGSADNIVFPAIQDVNGELKDYRGLPWQRTLDKAIQNNDYIEFPTEGDARYFGEHYKKYFPEYFSNQYADGGEMDTPKHWNELSMTDKSDAIASAVRNGVTTLEDIRKAWNDYADSSYQEETHEYLKGGYKPSAAIKNRIANWEGSSMQTNRSFDAEAKDFWNAIPSNVRSKLSQQQADALYSYSYNVGAGNFKKRVVPSLERYFNGNGSVEDVQRHMYATKDKDYRGLAKRRAVERAMFGGQRVEDVPSFDYDYSSNSSPYGHRFTVNNNFQTAGYLGPIVNGNSVNNDNTNKTNIFLQALEDEPKQTIAESTPEPRYNALERLQNIYSMYGMDDYAQEIGKYSPFEGLMFADGGKKSTNTKGVTSSNGQYHVNPADYWAVLGSAESNRPVEVTLPEVAVKAADPKNYRSSFHSEDIFPFMNVATAGLLNRGSVTQDARLLRDTYDAIAGNKSWKDVANSAILGNEGIFKNPWANLALDIAVPTVAGNYRNIANVGNQLNKIPVNIGKLSKKNPIELLSIGNVKDGSFHFNGFKEDPVAMHLKRAKAKGYDTSGIVVCDLSKDTPETNAIIDDIANRFSMTSQSVKDFLINHLNTHGHAGAIDGTKIIVHDGKARDKISALISHELDHAIHYPKNPIPKGTFFPRIINLHGNEFIKHNNTEVAARGSQLHDYFGHTGLEPLTPEELQYAKYHYVQDTGLNNNMNELLWSTKDLKKLAEWMTENSTGYVLPTLIGASYMSQKK